MSSMFSCLKRQLSMKQGFDHLTTSQFAIAKKEKGSERFSRLALKIWDTHDPLPGGRFCRSEIRRRFNFPPPVFSTNRCSA